MNLAGDLPSVGALTLKIGVHPEILVSAFENYFAFLPLSALNLAQRALVTLEIFALAAADMVRL
jgi:hypothetical protein